jgi:hypothetical protein
MASTGGSGEKFGQPRTDDAADSKSSVYFNKYRTFFESFVQKLDALTAVSDTVLPLLGEGAKKEALDLEKYFANLPVSTKGEHRFFEVPLSRFYEFRRQENRQKAVLLPVTLVSDMLLISLFACIDAFHRDLVGYFFQRVPEVVTNKFMHTSNANLVCN